MPMSEAAEKATQAINKYLADACSTEGVRQAHLCGSGAVAELECKLKRYYGMRYVLCVSNATTGLLALALALELKRNEFVTSPFTYGASLAGWLLLGNKPSFADIDPLSLTLDCELARKAITTKTRALLAVDIFGNPADQLEFRKLADEFGLWYIADAAQSLGAFRNGMPGSSLADALIVSFTTGKTVFAGEGGAVLTNNADLYQKLVWHTQHPYRQRRDIGLQLSNEFALNGRIHPLAAVWANATFEDSLRTLKQHQAESFKIIDTLNSSGLTEEIDFERHDILPAFFRLTAAWKGPARPFELLRYLEKNVVPAKLEPMPIQLIYKQTAFLAQDERSSKSIHRCLQAELQFERRFCVSKESDTHKLIALNQVKTSSS
jgi:perosamine synthetase